VHTFDQSKINSNFQVLAIFRRHDHKGGSLAWAHCPHSGRALSRGKAARPSPDKHARHLRGDATNHADQSQEGSAIDALRTMNDGGFRHLPKVLCFLAKAGAARQLVLY